MSPAASAEDSFILQPHKTVGAKQSFGRKLDEGLFRTLSRRMFSHSLQVQGGLPSSTMPVGLFGAVLDVVTFRLLRHELPVPEKEGPKITRPSKQVDGTFLCSIAYKAP
jgi:hypothetical protein